MNMILLSVYDLSLAAGLILILALLSFNMKLNIEKQLVIAAIRTAVQLVLIGLVLKYLFEQVNFWLITLLACIMLLAAGREVLARQQRTFAGGWGYGIGVISMFVSSFTVAILALTIVVQPDPWYTPQYAIPLLGMLLGNTMNGIALGMDRLTTSAWEQRQIIESRLLLGETWTQAIADIRYNSMRIGMIPMINAMAAAGIVSLPGMMTGQILAGSPPVEAVKYQILIMFLITAGTGFGTLTAVWFASKHLFDDRDRLRLDRFKKTR